MSEMKMKKMINDPQNFVDETVDGIIAAYGDRLHLLNGDKRILCSSYPTQQGKVGIITAGGSGHLPVFLGYVGQGMLDACVVGNVFASPAYTKMADAIRAVDQGAGVLCLFGNYGGDRMNLEQAREDVAFDDIRTEALYVTDDIASSPKETAEKRRAVAGMVYAFKIAGAAAAQMRSLDEVVAVTKRAMDNIRTIGVATSPCIVPDVGVPTFSIEPDEIEVGMGIHGEKGIEVCRMMRADEIAEKLMQRLLCDLPLRSGDEISVMINGLGATPLEEQLIVYRKVSSILANHGVTVFMPHIGEFATSMEMAGLSVTLFKLDDELKTLLRAPAQTPFYTNSNK